MYFYKWTVLVNILFVSHFVGRALSQEGFQCPDTCEMDVVETIPDGMDEVAHKSTFDSWKKLIDGAKTSIDFASYYWTLLPYEYPHPTANLGEEIYKSLLEAGTTRGVQIRVAKERDSANFPNLDLKDLVNANATIQVRDVNFTELIGAGILHTKMIIVDNEHIYLGSSNFDWRALTQVKEIGVVGWNCSCLARDMGKTFEIYWELANTTGRLSPDHRMPEEFSTPFNKDAQMDVTYSNVEYLSYVASSPPQFCTENRTTDLEAIYDVMEKAEVFIHIAVMDYFPLIMFDGPNKYWPDLDNKLKAMALERNVTVKLLIGYWANTRGYAKNILQSLESMKGNYPYYNIDIQVKLFVVPTDEDQAKIPYARVNHNKYIVTEKSAYFGTSNWSGDYFISTGGVSIVITPKVTGSANDIRTQLANVFQRDWNSRHAKSLSEVYQESTALTKSATAFLITSMVLLSATILN